MTRPIADRAEVTKWAVRNALKPGDYEQNLLADQDATVPKTHREGVIKYVRDLRTTKAQPTVPGAPSAPANLVVDDLDDVLNSIPDEKPRPRSQPPAAAAAATTTVSSLFPTLATRDTEVGSNKSDLQQKLLGILNAAFAKASAQNAFTVLWEPFTYNNMPMRLVTTARYKTRDASPSVMWDINGSPSAGKGTFRDLDESYKILDGGNVFSVSIDQTQRIEIPLSLASYKEGQVFGQTNSKVEGRTFNVAVTLWLWALRVDKGDEYRLWLNERVSDSSPTDLLRWKEVASK